MRWVVSITLWQLCPRVRDPVSVVQKTGWALEPVGRVRKISPEPGFDPQTAQPVSCRYTDWAAQVPDFRLHHCAMFPADLLFAKRLFHQYCTSRHFSSSLIPITVALVYNKVFHVPHSMNSYTHIIIIIVVVVRVLNLLATDFFSNFSTPCI